MKNDLKAAIKKAKAWFRDPGLVTEPAKISVELPQALVHVGTIVAIEYDSDKFDGKSRIYRHDVTQARNLYISPDGATLIVDPPFRVTTRGIEG